MKKINLGQAISILANVGVIAGILLLATELRQNNVLMAAEARFNRLAVTTENYEILAQDGDMAEIWRKARSNELLTELEQTRMEAFTMRALLVREWTYRELPRDELPLERWRRNSEQIDAHRQLWEREKDTLDSGFVEFMDTNVFNR